MSCGCKLLEMASLKAPVGDLAAIGQLKVQVLMSLLVAGSMTVLMQYQPSVVTTCESWAAGHLGASALGLAQAILESSTFPLAFCLGIHSPTVTQVS